MRVFDVLAIVTSFFLPGTYNKTRIQNVYSAIRTKIKPY